MLGWNATMYRVAIGSGVQLTTYDLSKDYFINNLMF